MLTREQVAGCRATIKTDPKPNRRWRESIFVSALDSIDFLEGKLSSCESCLAEAEREIAALRSFVKDIATDYDHEECYHRNGLADTCCRQCKAEQLLNSEGRAGT